MNAGLNQLAVSTTCSPHLNIAQTLRKDVTASSTAKNFIILIHQCRAQEQATAAKHWAELTPASSAEAPTKRQAEGGQGAKPPKWGLHTQGGARHTDPGAVKEPLGHTITLCCDPAPLGSPAEGKVPSCHCSSPPPHHSPTDTRTSQLHSLTSGSTVAHPLTPHCLTKPVLSQEGMKTAVEL